MDLEEQHKIRFWAIRRKLIDPVESFDDNITKGEVLEMFYKLFEYNADNGSTKSYKEMRL